MPKQQHYGSLRLCVRLLDTRKISLEWYDPETRDAVWVETVELPADRGFVSQIACDGDFHVEAGHFLDQQGRRHFVLAAEPGVLGATV